MGGSNTRKTVWLTDWMGCIFGCAVYAAAAQVFITANEITPGGFTGLAVLCHTVTKLPTGIWLLLLNIPVFWLGMRQYGGRFIGRTVAITLLLSGLLTVTDFLPGFTADRGLAAVFGGLGMGFGLGSVLLHGATTGGVDIVAKVIHSRYPHWSVGRLILSVDTVVILLSAVVYGAIESALYSVVALYISGKVTDWLLCGADNGKLILTVTENPDSICKAVHNELHRGVTKIPATGSYTDRAYTLLICTVRRYQLAEIYRVVLQNDPNAFMVIGEASEIWGKGFKQWQ